MKRLTADEVKRLLDLAANGTHQNEIAATLGIAIGTVNYHLAKAKARPVDKGPSPIRHGTRGGYITELRRGGPTCPSCRAANTAYVQGQREEP